MDRNSHHLNPFDFINTFSIWVILGSFCMYLFTCAWFDIEFDLVAAGVLAGSMGVIYTLDHLIDGYRSKDQVQAKRHYFHYRYRNVLTIAVGVVGACLCYVVLVYLDPVYYRFGYLLVALTFIHFLMNFLFTERSKNRVFMKELFIALVVTLGFVSLPLMGRLTFDLRFAVLFAIIFLVNWSNLLLFSYFDYYNDARSNFLSAAHVYGREVSRRLAGVMLIIAELVVIYAIVAADVHALFGLVLSGMIALLGFMAVNPAPFKRQGRYRFYGDVIYLFPGLILPFL